MPKGSDQSPGIIPVTNDEWQQAHIFFKDNPGNIKLSKGQNLNGVTLNHSFVMVEGKCYAMQTTFCSEKNAPKGKMLGKGAFGKVRLAEDKDGNRFAVKVEGSGPQILKNAESTIMRHLGMLHGQAIRHREKKFLGKDIQNKKYSVMTLIPGEELYKQLHGANAGNDFSYRDRLQIGLQCANELKSLHERGILHCDIKAQNFMLKINSDKSFTVKVIDFGAARLLAKRGIDKGPIKLFKYASKSKGRPDEETAGTMGFLAHEIKGKTPVYSTASDVYALGVTLRVQLGLQEPFIDQMLAQDPNERPTMKQVIEHLNHAIVASRLATDSNGPIVQRINHYTQLSEKEKSGVLSFLANIQGVPLSEYKNIDFTKIDVDALIAIRQDLEKILDQNPQKWQKDLLPQVKDAIEKIIVNNILNQARTPEEAFDKLAAIEGFDIIKNRVGVPIKMVDKENTRLQGESLSDQDRQAALRKYISEYDYGSLEQQSANRLQQLFEDKYGLSLSQQVEKQHDKTQSSDHTADISRVADALQKVNDQRKEKAHVEREDAHTKKSLK